MMAIIKQNGAFKPASDVGLVTASGVSSTISSTNPKPVHCPYKSTRGWWRQKMFMRLLKRFGGVAFQTATIQQLFVQRRVKPTPLPHTNGGVSWRIDGLTLMNTTITEKGRSRKRKWCVHRREGAVFTLKCFRPLQNKYQLWLGA